MVSSEDYNSGSPTSPGAPLTLPKSLPEHRCSSVSGLPPSFDAPAAASPMNGGMSGTSSVGIFPDAKDPPQPAASSAKNSALSPEATDRVFPVRSVVSVDSKAAPVSQEESGDEFPGMGLNSIEGTRRESARRSSSAKDTPAGSRSAQPVKVQRPLKRHSTGAQLQSVASEDSRTRHSLDATAATSHDRDTHNYVNRMMRDDASLLSEKNSSVDGGASIPSRPESARSTANDPHLTARFKHVVTDGGHAVITGRDGDTLQRCEDEPIHIPGAIQSFGLLVALKEEAGKLVVRVVSENSAKIIGYTPEQLFRLSSFTDILTVEQADNLLDHLDFIRDESAADPSVNGPEVFMISLRAHNRRPQKFWCAMHMYEPNKDLIICEFELEDDIRNPLIPLGEPAPEPPENTLGSSPTPEELAESTVNVSKPLRVLRSARKKKGEAAAMEVFNIMAQVQEQLASAATLEKFLKILIGVVKELTGFHRVMIYQFDQHFNGRVVSELLDPRATKDLYMGLNFPASDIPKQARDLYRINKVRLLYDREQETSRLVCRTMDDLESPLDMTFAYLRAMSPIHIKYLHNMAVRSSMSISINAFDELWGLIACHSYGQRGMRVSFPIRKMCRLVGDTASRNIERLSYASRIQARKLINTAHTAANPSGYIVASSEDLLELFAAQCGALSVRDETKILGRPEGHLQEILAMLEFLRLRKISSVFTSNDVTTDFSDLRYPPGFQFIAGLLFVPLSSGGNDFIVFFRKSSSREVKWAGNPYEKFVKEGTEGYLEPRKSFKTWSEVVVGKCRDWTEQEIETAAVLCLVYGKFIEVWRQKEAALQNSQLQKLLLANSAHEVRTPLNAIINYLEIALEGNIDRETRENLSRSHSASKSLVYVINDLLDLTKTEEGLLLVKEEVFDFHMTMQEATEAFRGEAKRKNIDYQVTGIDDIPQFLVGDPRRLRQVVSNIITNAIQHTSSGYVKITTCKSSEQSEPEKVDIEIAIEDTGAGMPQQKVDALFRELEQVSYENEEFGPSILEKDAISKSSATDARSATLGLGLAVVARAIRNMNGQLRLTTEEGRGSRFVIQLVMNVAEKTDLKEHPEPGRASRTTPSLEYPTSSPTSSEDPGVSTNRSSQNRVQMLPVSRRGSQESVNSLKSNASVQSMKSANSIRSARSDVDRLIGDIQKPHLLSEPETPDLKRKSGAKSKKLNRSNSAGDAQLKSSNPPNAGVGKSLVEKVPGEEKVKDSRTPLKAVRLQGGEDDSKHDTAVKSPPRVAFEIPKCRIESCASLGMENLSVLVAEDDPINSKIMKKRLEKLGHTVHLTVNGEECSSALGGRPASFDVVLMDLQMPIVDGFTSTKMIRSFEKSNGDTSLSPRANVNGRIPIFAVSASLLEQNLETYIKTGFDGWILKPVNFQRVDSILRGIVEEDMRNACLFQAGQWEHGGWFEKRQPCTNRFMADTTPSGRRPAAHGPNPPASLTKADTL